MTRLAMAVYGHRNAIRMCCQIIRMCASVHSVWRARTHTSCNVCMELQYFLFYYTMALVSPMIFRWVTTSTNSTLEPTPQMPSFFELVLILFFHQEFIFFFKCECLNPTALHQITYKILCKIFLNYYSKKPYQYAYCFFYY